MAGPDRSSWFRGVHAKLASAKRHQERLGQVDHHWKEHAPQHAVSCKYDHVTGEGACWIEPQMWPSDLDFGVVLGHFVNDLRSCLDYAVHALWEINGTDPGGKSSWPVCTTTKEWEIATTRRKSKRSGQWNIGPLYGVSDSAKEVIRRHQPIDLRGDSSKADPIWQLIKVSNHDKHRVIQTALGIPVTPFGPRFDPPTGPIPASAIGFKFASENDTRILFMSLTPGDVPRQMYVNERVSLKPAVRIPGGAAFFMTDFATWAYDKVSHVCGKLYGFGVGPRTIEVPIDPPKGEVIRLAAASDTAHG